jgi:signal transduction histidine kinase
MRISLDLLGRGEKTHAAEYIAMLENDIERMTVMMNAIMEQGRQSFVPGDFMDPFDVCELLEESVRLANFEVRKGNREVLCALVSRPEGPVLLNGNRSLIEQAVHNLLSNALRYSPEGGQVDVALDSDPGDDEGRELRITVRDYGPGVPEESLGKLFRPFYRVDEARDQGSGGVGLGLALACQYIKRHRGDIVAENRHPGLAVRISLPLL